MEQQVKWPEQIHIEFQLERREYVQAVRFFLRRRHVVSWVQGLVLLFALAAVAVLTWMIGHLNFINTLVLVLAAMAALYGAYLYLIKPGLLFDRDPALHERVSFLFSREDVARQDSRSAAILDWDVQELWRGAGFYFLFDGEGSYTLLPLRAFQSQKDTEHFEEMVQDACPGAKIKRYR